MHLNVNASPRQEGDNDFKSQLWQTVSTFS